MPEKPLGRKAYGSIPHLPGSKRGPGDHGLSESQAAILTTKSRPDDLVVVREKIDGSNVAIAKINGAIIPLVRSGYRAESSPYQQHHEFAAWVAKDYLRWYEMLADGERLCGEWIAMSHGTRYDLSDGDEPFYGFDIFRENARILDSELSGRLALYLVNEPPLIHKGDSISVESALNLLGDYGKTGIALDRVEGMVWRTERKGKVEFLGKYVNPDFVPGKYFHEDDSPEWNPGFSP